MSVCRLLLDPPASGPWNMAVDETLLEWSAAEEGLALRFYRWEEATLSLGYFQGHEERSRHEASSSCPVVRRASGGGAIVHDRELTYAIVVPAGHRLAEERALLYRAIHSSLIAVLARTGIDSALCGDQEGRHDPRSTQPFLCFARRSPGDVVIGRTKIAGSAQRRCRGAVLQHGSVLLQRSSAAPELPGLGETTGRCMTADELTAAWLDDLEARLELEWVADRLTAAELGRAAQWVEMKYGAPRWTEGRGR